MGTRGDTARQKPGAKHPSDLDLSRIVAKCHGHRVTHADTIILLPQRYPEGKPRGQWVRQHVAGALHQGDRGVSKGKVLTPVAVKNARPGPSRREFPDGG